MKSVIRPILLSALTMVLIGCSGFNQQVNTLVDIELLDFELTKEFQNKGVWSGGIEVRNRSEKMVVIEAYGTAKQRNWSWIGWRTVDPSSSRKLDLKISHYFMEDLAFDKKKITIQIYECAKLPERVANEIYLSAYGGGIPSPWDVLREKRDSGKPVKPTFVSTLYLDFSSVDSPPSLISESEYNK